jgi:hypothetical protein
MPNLTTLRARNLLKKGYKGFPSRINTYTGCLKNGAQSLEWITYSKSRVKFRCQFFCPLASFQVIHSLK